MIVDGSGPCADLECGFGRRAFRAGQPTAIFAAAAVLSLCGLIGCSRTATQAESQKPVTPAISYISSWGMRGNGPGQLDQPVSIATDRVGDVRYIADAGSYFVHKFDWRGTPLLSFQEPGLRNPQSITLDSGGAIYVTDSQRGSAFVFLPGGERYRELRLSTRAKPDDELDVAVADDGVSPRVLIGQSPRLYI